VPVSQTTRQDAPFGNEARTHRLTTPHAALPVERRQFFGNLPAHRQPSGLPMPSFLANGKNTFPRIRHRVRGTSAC
jgi:hypothetical protein